MLDQLVFATTNEDKIREAREILGIEVESADIPLTEIQSLDPVEVAYHKALYAFSKVGAPVIVEDTSLVFRTWKELPGVYIDAFMQTVGNEGLLKMLAGCVDEDRDVDRSALARVTIGLCIDRKNCHTFTGQIAGNIAPEPRGENGFGWDSIFIPKGEERTFAEMTADEKNAISHRRRAFEALAQFLAAHNFPAHPLAGPVRK